MEKDKSKITNKYLQKMNSSLGLVNFSKEEYNKIKSERDKYLSQILALIKNH